MIHTINVEIKTPPRDNTWEELARMVERSVGHAADEIMEYRDMRRYQWWMKTVGDAKILRDRLRAGFPELNVFMEVIDVAGM